MEGKIYLCPYCQVELEKKAVIKLASTFNRLQCPKCTKTFWETIEVVEKAEKEKT